MNQCIVCGVPGTNRWTIDDGTQAAVMYLCPEHEAPMVSLMEAAGIEPPSRQTPKGGRTPDKQPRRRTMMPLLDWTPPSS